MTLHLASVAGTFYPADPAELAAGVDGSMKKSADSSLAPKAVIAPHAGHIYSGAIAGSAYALLAKRKGEIKRVVLMGPNHCMPVRGFAVSPADAWATPFGPLAVDKAALDELSRQPGVETSMVPFQGEHSLEVHLPFIHRALGDVEILPMLVGQVPCEVVSAVLERLWGGPETAIIVSSDLSHFHDYDTCRKKDEETTIAIERLQRAGLDGDRACGTFSIHGLLDQAQRRDLRVTAIDVRNSGDTKGTRDRVVGYGAFAFEYAHEAQLDKETRRMLLDLARAAVTQGVLHRGQMPRLNVQGTLPRPLLAQRATFVTLTINGQLRGCRGSVLPHRSLIADVADNAIKSAFGDPRFPPLSDGELQGIKIHVSILSSPRRILCKSEAELVSTLRPDVDGLFIRDGTRQGLLLPSVWEQIPDPVTFVRQLKLKAGLPAEYWSPALEAYRFGTESFGDH